MSVRQLTDCTEHRDRRNSCAFLAASVVPQLVRISRLLLIFRMPKRHFSSDSESGSDGDSSQRSESGSSGSSGVSAEKMSTISSEDIPDELQNAKDKLQSLVESNRIVGLRLMRDLLSDAIDPIVEDVALPLIMDCLLNDTQNVMCEACDCLCEIIDWTDEDGCNRIMAAFPAQILLEDPWPVIMMRKHLLKSLGF